MLCIKGVIIIEKFDRHELGVICSALSFYIKSVENDIEKGKIEKVNIARIRVKDTVDVLDKVIELANSKNYF